MSDKIIEVLGLCKKFDNFEVLKGINFEVLKGEVVSFIGPSGSGKSTMLRCIVELVAADSGDILIKGKYVCKNGFYSQEPSIKEIRNKTGMVFQNFNLFPHMSVEENLKCAPRLANIYKKDELDYICEQNLKKVNLLDKLKQMPSKLSGGQKQRVAIARALMMKPDILLFDEPTSALDPELTQEVLNVIKDLKNTDITMIVVTHEMRFARDVSNKIFFMDDGVILESGTPKEIFESSKNERIKQFLQNSD